MGRRIRTLYDNDHSTFQEKTINLKPTMTLQHLQEHTNIKAILQKYEERGSSALELADISAYTSYDKNYTYQDIRDHMLTVEEDFQKLPSSVRQQFGHNPGLFYEYMLNPKNIEDGIKRGIFVDTREKPPVPKSDEETIRELQNKILEEERQRSLETRARMGLGIAGGKG